MGPMVMLVSRLDASVSLVRLASFVVRRVFCPRTSAKDVGARLDSVSASNASLAAELQAKSTELQAMSAELDQVRLEAAQQMAETNSKFERLANDVEELVLANKAQLVGLIGDVEALRGKVRTIL